MAHRPTFVLSGCLPVGILVSWDQVTGVSARAGWAPLWGIYDTIRATAQKPGGARAEEGQAHTLVLRIVIEDLQQTVSPPARRPRSSPWQA